MAKEKRWDERWGFGAIDWLNADESMAAAIFFFDPSQECSAWAEEPERNKILSTPPVMCVIFGIVIKADKEEDVMVIAPAVTPSSWPGAEDCSTKDGSLWKLPIGCIKQVVELVPKPEEKKPRRRKRANTKN